MWALFSNVQRNVGELERKGAREARYLGNNEKKLSRKTPNIILEQLKTHVVTLSAQPLETKEKLSARVVSTPRYISKVNIPHGYYIVFSLGLYRHRH